MSESIDVQVRQIIAEVLEIELDQVRADMHFINDLAANSLDIVELVMRLEDVFQIEIPDESVEGVQFVRDIIAFAHNMMGPEEEGADAVSELRAQVLIASDHAGFTLKERLKAVLHDMGYVLRDLGPANAHPIDYTDSAARLGHAIQGQEAPMGILICGTGIGMAIAANKIAGIRAASVHTELEAQKAREHVDANVLCLGARILGVDQAESCLRAFLAATFDEGDDGRNKRRVEAISALEGAA